MKRTTTRWVVKTVGGFMGPWADDDKFEDAVVWRTKEDARGAAFGMLSCYVHPVKITLDIPELSEDEAG